jgi:hypothetical protein
MKHIMIAVLGGACLLAPAAVPALAEDDEGGSMVVTGGRSEATEKSDRADDSDRSDDKDDSATSDNEDDREDSDSGRSSDGG